MSLAPHTTLPSAHRPPVRRTTEHLAPHGQKRPRSGGHPYSPGMFDALIDRPVLDPTHARPEQVRGVTIELAASGRSVIVAEQLRSGAGPRHLLTLEEPHSVFMRLADGREVWVEIRAIAPVADEDREPWETESPIEDPRDVIRGGGSGGIREITLDEARTMYPEHAAESSPSPSSFACLEFLPR